MGRHMRGDESCNAMMERLPFCADSDWNMVNRPGEHCARLDSEGENRQNDLPTPRVVSQVAQPQGGGGTGYAPQVAQMCAAGGVLPCGGALAPGGIVTGVVSPVDGFVVQDGLGRAPSPREPAPPYTPPLGVSEVSGLSKVEMEVPRSGNY